MDQFTTRAARPVHLWIVGLGALLWNSFGAFDFTMTNLRGAEYLQAMNMPPEMMRLIDAFPVWATVAWACGVWGAMLGAALLLLRSRYAVHAFALSLAGLAVSSAYQATLDMPESMRNAGMLMMNVVIWAGALFFLWYAVRMRKAGVLR